MEKNDQLIGLGILAILALLVFILSPFGSLVLSILAMIPSGLWGWLLGVAALLAAIILARYIFEAR